MKLGVFTVGLPDLAPEGAVREIKAAGYDGVEWRVARIPEEVRGEKSSFWRNNLCTLEPSEEEALRVRTLGDSAELQTAGLGTYIGVGALHAVDEAMNFAQVAHASQIRVGPGSLQGATYALRFERAKQFLAGVEKLAGQYGIKELVEIHHGTICPSASLAHRLVSGLDLGAIRVIFDPGNMVFEGFEDYRIGTVLLGPYLAHVHLKNAAFDRPEGGGTWRPRWAPLGVGVVDFEQLFEALRIACYDRWLVMEDFSVARTSGEALRHNLWFMQDLVQRVLAKS